MDDYTYKHLERWLDRYDDLTTRNGVRQHIMQLIADTDKGDLQDLLDRGWSALRDTQLKDVY